MSRQQFSSIFLIFRYVFLSLLCCSAFQPMMTQRTRHCSRLHSSLGNDGPPPPSGDKSNNWDEFYDPKDESESMMKAREYLNENSLPISFDQNNSDDGNRTTSAKDSASNTTATATGSSALVSTDDLMGGNISPEILADNPYMNVVSRLAPSDLIAQFTTTAHPRVQNAVRHTILGLIGGLPKMAFDTTTVTTGQKLASLMFQLQMTGYMFKNADYRLSVEQSLNSELLSADQFLLPRNGEEKIDPLAGKVNGKLRIRMPSKTNDDGDDDDGTVVDAAAYMSELRSEVSKLRDELVVSKQEKEEAVRKDLLMYIRTLPKQELQSLTNTMSHDVLIAMKGLVNAVLSGLGEGQIGPDTMTEQSGEAMAQLCMWQLVIGYNLRTLEVREEMKKSLQEDIGEGGINLEPGTLE